MRNATQEHNYSYIHNYLHSRMSDNNEQMVNTVNDHQHEKVDYADPESPTLAVRQSALPTTGPVERLSDVVETDNNADMADKHVTAMEVRRH